MEIIVIIKLCQHLKSAGEQKNNK